MSHRGKAGEEPLTYVSLHTIPLLHMGELGGATTLRGSAGTVKGAETGEPKKLIKSG